MISVIGVLIHTVWASVPAEDVNAIAASGSTVIDPDAVCCAQVPVVVTV